MNIEQFILLKNRENTGTVKIMHTEELFSYDNIEEIANPYDYIEGITNHKGQAVPIIDLEKLINNRNSTKCNEKLIVISLAGVKLGLLVKSSYNISFQRSSINCFDNHLQIANDKFIVGVENSKSIITLIDLTDVLSMDSISELHKIMI